MIKQFFTFSVLFLLTINLKADEIVIFDAKTEQSEYITRVEIPDRGFMFRVDFTSINCDSLELRLGYSPDEKPAFLDTIPRFKMPIMLDKTKFSTEYQGVEFNDFPVDILEHNGKYLWLEILPKVTCTSGQVILKI